MDKDIYKQFLRRAFDDYAEERDLEPRGPMFQATFTLKDWEREDPSVEGTWNPDSLDCFWLRSCGIDPL